MASFVNPNDLTLVAKADELENFLFSSDNSFDWSDRSLTLSDQQEGLSFTENDNDIAMSSPAQQRAPANVGQGLQHPGSDVLGFGIDQNPTFSAVDTQQIPWPEDISADQFGDWSAEPLRGPGGGMDAFRQDVDSGMQHQQPLPYLQPEDMLAGLQQPPSQVLPSPTEATCLQTAFDKMDGSMPDLGAAMPQLPADLTTADMWQGGMTQPPMPQSTSPPWPRAVAMAPGPPPTSFRPQRQQRGRRTAPRRGKTPQQCGDCNFKSGNKEEFRRHVDSVHNKIRRHRCEVCDVNVNDPSGLSKHMRSAKHVANARHQGVHASSKRYGCRFCSRLAGEHKSYARSDQLKRHLKTCRNCTHLGPERLPPGYASGAQGMDDGLLLDGQAWGFLHGP